jgi:hypothetical protein
MGLYDWQLENLPHVSLNANRQGDGSDRIPNPINKTGETALNSKQETMRLLSLKTLPEKIMPTSKT